MTDWVDLGKSLAPWAQTFGTIIVMVGFVVAAASLRVTIKTNKAKFVLELTDSFLKDEKLLRFWYSLDYEGKDSFIFDLKSFRASETERLLDTLLHKFSVVGRLLRTGAIGIDDIQAISMLCRQTFNNEQVRNYLRYVILDFWRIGVINQTFNDALYLYEKMTTHFVAKGWATYEESMRCRCFIRQLEAITRDETARREVAATIKYDHAIDSCQTRNGITR
jgi:hypothetical protein